MGDENSLEEEVQRATRGIVDGLGQINPLPEEIILKNGGENTALFRSSLEGDLKGRYSIPISLDCKKEGYVVDINLCMKVYKK